MRIHINTLGIVFATLGSYLVWRYLTELNWADKEAFLRGEGVLTVPSPTVWDVKKFRCQLLLSKLGLMLIVFGGAIQVMSNYLPE